MNDDTLTPDAVPRASRAARNEAGTIAWALVHERIGMIGRLLDGGTTAEAEDELLRDRARRLAIPPDDQRSAPLLELVRIILGGSQFVVPSKEVAAVVRGAEIAPLPGSTGTIVAIASWRGRLLPGVDIRPLLGLTRAATRSFIVIGDDVLDAVLIVDSVEDLELTDPATIGRLPDGGGRSGVLSAVLADGTPLIDIPGVLLLARAPA